MQATKRDLVLAGLAPGTYDFTAGEFSTSYMTLSKFKQIVAYISTGLMGTGGKIDFKFVQAKDASGTDVKDTSKSITQVLKAVGDNKVIDLSISENDIDIKNGFIYIAGVLTVSVADSIVSVACVGTDPIYLGMESDNVSITAAPVL